MLISCSSDGTCKIFEIPSLRNLSKLTFRNNINEKKGYLFRSMIFDEKNNYLFTNQAPLTGDSYITKWDVNKGFKPIDSAKICNVSTASIDIDYNSNTLAIGDNKGSIVFLDACTLEKNKEIRDSELTIKTVKYHRGNLISGSADNSIRVHKNHSKGIFTFKNILKILFLAFIINILVLIHKEKKLIIFSHENN